MTVILVQPIAYDERTDIIEPFGQPRTTAPNARVEFVELITGWGPWTQRVRVFDDEYPLGWWALA